MQEFFCIFTAFFGTFEPLSVAISGSYNMLCVHAAWRSPSGISAFFPVIPRQTGMMCGNTRNRKGFQL